MYFGLIKFLTISYELLVLDIDRATSFLVHVMVMVKDLALKAYTCFVYFCSVLLRFSFLRRVFGELFLDSYLD